MNKGSWQQARLRFGGGGPMFGWMHEDAEAETALIPVGGSAACVLSAGDVAFALLRAGAREVVAADPSPLQHELVKLKLAAARRGDGIRQVSDQKAGEILASMDPGALPHSWHRRPMLAAGSVDARLRWIARHVTPLVAGHPCGKADWQAVFKRKRWRLAWRLLALAVRCVFPLWYRRHLPGDFIMRLRQRFESCCLRDDAETNPLLRRLLSRTVGGGEDEIWMPAWPPTEPALLDRLHLHEGVLGDLTTAGPFDMVAASNILDTRPAAEINDLLAAFRAAVVPGGWLVLRSLFREAEDWPEPPPNWVLDSRQTHKLRQRDRSPFCQISAVFQRR